MICILAPSHHKAKSWADNQGLEKQEWFYASSPESVKFAINFHVIVIGEFAEHQLTLFEKTYHVAKQQGRINRI